MILGRLPPAGDRVTWGGGAPGTARVLFAPWHPVLFGTGTEALAAVLHGLRRHAPARDEVIFSAYNCPSLASAALHAGCKPVLVDLFPDRPWLDFAALEAALSARTLAVIAVDFLGIPERYVRLRELCRQAGCTLIQDSAQSFPLRAGEAGFEGDAVILSFGRGKPVSLLGGGAALLRERALAAEIASTRGPAQFDRRRETLRRIAYNLLRRPAFYWLPAALPGLRLGQTVFRPLEAITHMPGPREENLAGAIAAYRGRNSVQSLYAGVGDGHNVVDLPVVCGISPTRKLSRYPLLLNEPAVRERFLSVLTRYGVSPLYGTALPCVANVPPEIRAAGRFPNAESFAARLVTLPTHDGVTPACVARIKHRLDAQSGNGRQGAEARL